MDEQEIARRVRMIRACPHDRAHYYDTNGNRCCLQCNAYVRPNPAATVISTP